MRPKRRSDAFEHREHDLTAFMGVVEAQLAAEYTRIQQSVKDDPGTAGDQGEENWATLLRGWLPATYPIVTKGRLINERGDTSPQLDVMVLRPDYPMHLRDKKVYLSGGVVAAFECKLTLRGSHLPKIVETCKAVKSLSGTRTGTPFRELQRPILYGVLAHSHAWKPGKDGAMFTIMESTEGAIYPNVQQPWEIPDVVCVADVATYVLSKSLAVWPHVDSDTAEIFPKREKVGGVTTCYFAHYNHRDLPFSRGVVLGSLIGHVTYLLACENPELRPYASYFLGSDVVGAGLGRPVAWSADALSKPVLERLRECGYVDGEWDDWRQHIV